MKTWEWNWQTIVIISLIGVFAIVFARAESAYDKVSHLQKTLKSEVKENCLRDNYRVSTGVAAFLVMAKAAEQRREVWTTVYNFPNTEPYLPFKGKIRDLAAVQIGSNRLEAQALRELASALANFEGPDSIDPYSPDLFIRAQKKC